MKLLLYFVVTVILTVLIGVTQEQLKISYEKIALPQAAPAVAFLVITSLFPILKIRLNITFNKLVFIKLLLALLIPFCLLLMGFYLCRMLGFGFEQTGDLTNTLPLAIGGMLFGAVGEETGWRGFLQPSIEKQTSKIPATIITGTLWGLWHIGNYQYGLVFMIGFILFMTSASLILRIILDNTDNNLLISIFFHLGINIGFYVFFKNSLTNEKMICLNAIIWAATAVVMLTISKRRNKRRIKVL